MIKLKEIIKPLNEAVDEGDFVNAMQEIRAGLDEAEYGINSLNRLSFKGRDKSTAKKLERDFKKLYKSVDKFERDWLKNFLETP
tara:strand:- start:199 stop:450 length:252 start_codon:yes stop_codon:yes gene_type:complete